MLKLKLLKYLNGLKSENISDDEMMKTFNCGSRVLSLSLQKKTIKKIKKYFL